MAAAAQPGALSLSRSAIVPFANPSNPRCLHEDCCVEYGLILLLSGQAPSQSQAEFAEHVSYMQSHDDFLKKGVVRMICKGLASMIDQVNKPRQITRVDEDIQTMRANWELDRNTPTAGCPGCEDPAIGPGVHHKKHFDRINGCARCFSMTFEEVYQNYCAAQEVNVDRSLTDGTRAVFTAAWHSDINTRPESQQLVNNLPLFAAVLYLYQFSNESKFAFQCRFFKPTDTQLPAGWPDWPPNCLVPRLTIAVTQPGPPGKPFSASAMGGKPSTLDLARQIGPIVHYRRDHFLLSIDEAGCNNIQGNSNYILPQRNNATAGLISCFTAINAPLEHDARPLLHSDAEGNIVRLDIEKYIELHGPTIYLDKRGRCFTNIAITGVLLKVELLCVESIARIPLQCWPPSRAHP